LFEKEDLTFLGRGTMQLGGWQVMKKQEKGMSQQQKETFGNAE
jgi:hypothetical protein